MSCKTFLKMKICSLAGEARGIRREEQKWRGPQTHLDTATCHKSLGFNMRVSLHEHRVNVVRKECRAAHLAYGFLRGRAYLEVENKTKDAPDIAKVAAIVKRFSREDDRILMQRFAEWIDNSGLPYSFKIGSYWKEIEQVGEPVLTILTNK